MILVTLGTQDKEFKRLLEQIDKEISKGTIKEEVIVQAGYTKYESPNMKIFDFISREEYAKMIKDCSLLITHGGVGSILQALEYNKVVIAAPRLKKFKEHDNDHQLEIIEEFSSKKYILPLKDFNRLSKTLEKAKTFKPKKYESNTKNMVKLLEDYIDKL